MAEKKAWGKTVLGWFVVEENEPKGDTAEDADALIKRYSGGEVPAASPPSVELKGELPRAEGGALEFPKIYSAAGIDAAAQDRVKKALDLLRSLPAETPLATKQQIVEASLKAFGYPIPDLIEAGVSEIQALESFIQHEAQTTQETVSKASARIEKLNQEIADLRTVMQQKIAEQGAATKLCNSEKLVIQQVLEFFGMDAVAQVVHDSPKLIEPDKK
jgi:hypothetical protein